MQEWILALLRPIAAQMGLREMLLANVALSALAGLLAYSFMLYYIPLFKTSKRNMCGRDLCKVGGAGWLTTATIETSSRCRPPHQCLSQSRWG